MKSNITKALSLCLALLMCIGCAVPASAADVANATIHDDAACSLTIWKYDITAAAKDGAWGTGFFTSTGYRESYVEDVLGNTVREGDPNGTPDNSLGNGQNSNGYAIKGVGFTYLKVADIVTFTESENDRHPDYNQAMVLYGFNKTAAANLLSAIGLADGSQRYENADATGKLDSSMYYYTSDTLNHALASALGANSTTVKDALERYIKSTGGTSMPLTDENGKAQARDLPVGLYLVVETTVPEMVTSTVNPFFVSLPMTTVSGDGNSASPEGGHCWNYDVVVYPKNETGIPTLEKTVREAKADTGSNGGSGSITDGYAHNATGSTGDIMEYQIISTLPTITSRATALQTYSFCDSLSAGLSYTRGDVTVEFFTDAACTNKVDTWVENDGNFTVDYSADNHHMTVNITAAGLGKINGNGENANGKLYAGYSNYTVRVTYTAEVNSDASFIYGDNGNPNEVVLTWKRTSQDYYDTLIDDAHVYSYGLELTKVFSGTDSDAAANDGLFGDVKFKIYNETDGYWVSASLNAAEGTYYVTGPASEADATIFSPVTSNGAHGKVIVKGMEDDSYRITEVETANGYTLLKEPIRITIKASDDPTRACGIYARDVLGLLQNDPRYTTVGDASLDLSNIPQKALAHNYLTASATVDTNKVSMKEDNGSTNARVPLTVVNTRGFDLPQTGDNGTWMYSVFGIALMATGSVGIFVALRKKKGS